MPSQVAVGSRFWMEIDTGSQHARCYSYSNLRSWPWTDSQCERCSVLRKPAAGSATHRQGVRDARESVNGECRTGCFVLYTSSVYTCISQVNECGSARRQLDAGDHVRRDGIHMRCRWDLRLADYTTWSVFTGAVNARDVTALCGWLPGHMQGDTSAHSHVAGQRAEGQWYAINVGCRGRSDAAPGCSAGILSQWEDLRLHLTDQLGIRRSWVVITASSVLHHAPNRQYLVSQ